MLKALKDKYYRNRPMVSYWKSSDSVQAKVFTDETGVTVMQMKGEKYRFPGYPRGLLLFGKLSPLKHQIKNKIFNETWALLEQGVSEAEIQKHLATKWEEIYALGEQTKYDMLPPEKMCPAVKELHRSMTHVGVDTRLRDIICFILQEDDAYRMRAQWLVKFFPWFQQPSIADWLQGLTMLEEGEVVGDMKERERLFKRVFMAMVRDSHQFRDFLRETDWRKVKLTEADKYFFRAKYFKVDYPEYQY